MAASLHTAPVPALPSRSAAGIACVMGGMVMFVGQDLMMKALLGDFTVWMLYTARALVALVVLTPMILLLGPPHRLFSPLWPLHLARAALFAVGFALFYTAFPFMGLAEVTTIFFAAPLMTALIAALFLGESVGPQRIACLAIGFAGVVIAMNPGGAAFDWIAVLPLMTALSYAASQVLARKIGERDTTLTLGLHTIVLAGVIAMPLGWGLNRLLDLGPDFAHIGWAWEMPGTDGLLLALLLGAVGTVGYLLISRAYQIATASLVAPFDYAYLPIAAVAAYALWGEVPGWHTMVGMVLIVGSGLYLGYREIVQAGRRTLPVPTGETAFVPGAPVGALPHAADTGTAEAMPGPELR